MMQAQEIAKVAGQVATAKGDSINAGMWTLVGIALSVISAISIAVIKQWGPWQDSAARGREADFQRLREDVDRAKEERAAEIDRVRAELSEARHDAHEARSDAKKSLELAQRMETMLVCIRPAVTILAEEVRRLDPNSASNPALKQAMQLMEMAASGDLGFTAGLTRLATATSGVQGDAARAFTAPGSHADQRGTDIHGNDRSG